MKKRIVIAVGGVGILTSVWVLSWKKYQGEVIAPKIKEFRESEAEEKASKKPYRSKRFPAAKVQINKSVKKIKYDSQMVMRKLKPISGSGIISHPSTKIFSGKTAYNLTTNIKVMAVSKRGLYDPSQIVDQKYGKIFVRERPALGDPLVIQNSRTKQLAILTGVFKIKLYDHERWQDLATEYDLVLEGNFPGIRLSLLKTRQASDAPALLEELIKDPRIERVELEILENAPVIK